MLPNMFLRTFKRENSREKKSQCKVSEETDEEWQNVYSVPFQRDRFTQGTKFALRSNGFRNRSRGLKKSMSDFSHLIQRATCLAAAGSDEFSGAEEEDYEYQNTEAFDFESDWGKLAPKHEETPSVMEIEMLIGQVFDAISGMKRAYISLQEGDPDKMRVSDLTMVAELRRLGILKGKFRDSIDGIVREAVSPYETAVEKLKRELKMKHEVVESLREKLKTAAYFSGGKAKGKSKRRVSCTSQVSASPAMELFESTMNSVKQASESFTSLLLTLMRRAHWDITAAVRSIESTTLTDLSPVEPNHAKFALESYINNKIFQGFDHETFYMDYQNVRDCFTQYRDMKSMDPIELLSVLPSCSFGNFCIKKYLSIVHPKMEESLFGNLDMRKVVMEGNHPRSRFYKELLELAKAVWLLHLLAFSMDPPPSHFEASRGAEFHSQYMESVVRVSGGGGGAKVGMAMVVGFPVSPGFKLGNGSIVKTRVFLVSQ